MKPVRLQVNEVLSPDFCVAPNTKVSKNSCFGDDTWDFTNTTNKRISSTPDSRLRIEWDTYCSSFTNDQHFGHPRVAITKSMVDELKLFGYLYLNLASAFGLRGNQSIKPQTMVITVRTLILLFSEVLLSYQCTKEDQSPYPPPIQSITDIPLRAIRKVLDSSTRVDGAYLKKGLKLLASPVMAAAYQQRSLQWNTQDVKTLTFKFPKKRTDYQPVMPNPLFRLLSNTACSDVLGFLKFIGERSHDQAGKPYLPEFAFSVGNGATLIADYISLRRSDREFSARTGKKRTGPCPEAITFKCTYGVGRKEVFNWLYRIQRAAYMIIGLYTGARYSDMTTFTNDCIQTIHGVHVLVGTHVKNQPLDAAEDTDIWPAIPIMRDAIACLQVISQATFNPYLISQSATVPIGEIPIALSNKGYTEALTSYLHLIDVTGRWSDWHINSHQLRHTLAHQLARADVGLLFIAHQMKHLYTALRALPPDVTMMYGNIGELATQRALHSDSAYHEAAQELYTPDRPVAGGGAKAFIERRKAYFEGMAAQGWTVDEIIESLAKQGLPFASVGIGYCGGKRDTLLKDGSKDTPPCIGSLQCNPGICKQAVITRTHASSWRKIRDQNEELASDPRMAHSRDSLLASVHAAEEVLATLGVPIKMERS